MTDARRAIEYLFMQAACRKNNEHCDIKWNLSTGTSGNSYLWADCRNVRCYMYLTKNGNVKDITFSVNGNEVGYREACRMAQ